MILPLPHCSIMYLHVLMYDIWYDEYKSGRRAVQDVHEPLDHLFDQTLVGHGLSNPIHRSLLKNAFTMSNSQLVHHTCPVVSVFPSLSSWAEASSRSSRNLSFTPDCTCMGVTYKCTLQWEGQSFSATTSIAHTHLCGYCIQANSHPLSFILSANV